MKVLMYLSLIIVCNISANGNILKNPDFKEGRKHWQVSKSTVRLGSDGQLMLQSDAGEMSIQQKIKTTTVWTKYEIILQIKTQGKFTGKFYCQETKKPWTKYFKGKIGRLTKGFKEYKFSVVSMPTKTIENAVFRILFSGKGKIKIKSIRIIQRPMPQKKQEQNSGKNLLTGSGFELGDTRYTVGWTGFSRELGYKNILEYNRAENSNSLNRMYNLKDKIEGSQSLELKHVSQHLITFLYSEPIISMTGYERPIIFSVYMKAVHGTPDIEFRVKSGVMGSQKTVKKKFKLTSEWRRYSIIGKIHLQGQIAIFFKGKGTILIDAAMFEFNNGKTPSKYKPGRTFDCFIKSPVSFGVSFEGVPQDFTLICLNNQKATGKLSATVQFMDYWGKKIKELSFELKDTIKKQSIKLPQIKLPTGYYKVSCEIRYNGQQQAYRENAITIVPKRDITKFIDTPFGFHSPLTAGKLHLLKMVGVSMVRTHLGLETKWRILEQQKGKFNDIEDLFEIATQNKIKALGSLDYTPLWASPIKPDFPSLKKYRMPRDLGYWAKRFPSKNMEDMLDYVRHTVKKYIKYTKYWETWNEVYLIDNAEDRINKPFKAGFMHLTVEELLSRSKRIYEVIKKISPDAVVIGQYACHPPYDQFDKLINAGAMNYIDKLAVHFYQGSTQLTPPDEPTGKGYPPLRKQIKHWRSLMKKNGKVVGIWDTEFGPIRTRSNYKHLKYLINWEGPLPKLNTEYIVKSYLVKISLGIEKIFYFSTLNTIHLYPYNSIIEFDGRLKPVVAGFAVMTKLFTGVKFCPDLVDDKYCHIIKTKNKNGFIYALWLKSAGSYSGIDFKLQAKKSMTVINIMGNTVNNYPVKLGTEPIYIQSSKPVDKLLLSLYKNSSQQTK